MSHRTRKLFGTDGVRGKANVYPMTSELALSLGRCIAYFAERGFSVDGARKKRRPTVVIGKDTRLSGYMLETAMASGICSMGADVLLVGPLPTPGISFITRSMRADAGVVISASHNPFEDNGIKFFAADGFKLPDSIEAGIEELIFSNALDELRPTKSRIGKAFRIDDALGRYVVYLKGTFPAQRDLVGLRVVVDCANGAAYKVAPAVLRELGAEVISIAAAPDGMNINHRCGSTHPTLLQRTVKKHGAHIGIALDGDADRVVFADEHGEVVDGDAILALCALRLERQGRLANHTLVATVMSNLGLDEAMRHAGVKVVRTQVGDRYVVDEMRTNGYNLGGEQSGHIVFMDQATTGDGMLAALQVLATMREENKPLSELARVMNRYPQVLTNIAVRERRPLDELSDVQSVISRIEQHMNGSGRVLVRYSGTENKARVLVEGRDEAACNQWAQEIAGALQAAIGAPP